MKNALSITLFGLSTIIIISCGSRSLYSHYTLQKKYPYSITEIDLQISGNSGKFIDQTDSTNFQKFKFLKSKNFLILSQIDENHNLINLKKDDTLIFYKKEIFVINKNQKLIFKKK